MRGDEADVPFENEKGGFEGIEVEGASIGEKGGLARLIDGDAIGEEEAVFFFVPNELLSSEMEGVGSEGPFGVFKEEGLLREVEVEAGARDLILVLREAAIFARGELMGGKGIDPFVGYEFPFAIEGAVDVFELLNGFGFVFFLRDGEIGFDAADLKMVVLRPDVLLHVEALLMGRFVREGVAGALLNAVVDEGFKTDGIVGREANMGEIEGDGIAAD